MSLHPTEELLGFRTGFAAVTPNRLTPDFREIGSSTQFPQSRFTTRARLAVACILHHLFERFFIFALLFFFREGDPKVAF